MIEALGALSADGFLGGRVRLCQPVDGYRAGIDPVLLAAAVPATAGQSVLDLGCGAGTALICLGARVPDLDLTGVERQAAYADLARRNAVANGVPAGIVTGDVAALPGTVTARRFDHVIANPPWYRGGSAARDPGRNAGLREATPLAVWIDAALRRLAPRGRLTVIQRADRLGDLLAAVDSRAGRIVVRPVAPRSGADASRVIVSALQGARTPLRLASPLALHGPSGGYTAAVEAMLRDAAAWPDQI